MKYLTVVGARPNFIKLIPELCDILVHTGQHWEASMSDDFFTELNLPKPKYNLHTTKLGLMVNIITDIIRTERPTGVIVYGDTRSSFAGALSANETRTPLIHIEAGCRNYDKTRPEENYRVVIDHLSTTLFCVNDRCSYNLAQEGITRNVFVVGDMMYDRYLERRPNKGYLLLTIHRDEHMNFKDLSQIMSFVGTFDKVLFPVHPRTRGMITKFGVEIPKNTEEMSPVSYGKMQELIRDAKYVATDSGGVQREASFMGVPCLIFGESEWKNDLNRFGHGDTGKKIIEILRGKK